MLHSLSGCWFPSTNTQSTEKQRHCAQAVDGDMGISVKSRLGRNLFRSSWFMVIRPTCCCCVDRAVLVNTSAAVVDGHDGCRSLSCACSAEGKDDGMIAVELGNACDMVEKHPTVEHLREIDANTPSVGPFRPLSRRP